MASNNITSTQLVAYLLSTVTATAMMNAAPILYRNFGQNAIIVIVLIAVITAVLLLLVAQATRKTNFISPVIACERALGRYGGKAVYAIICLYLLLLSAFSLRIFIYIINLYYLQKTPMLIIAMLVIIPSLYTAYGGLRVFAHTASLLYLFWVIFFSIFILAKNNFTASNLFPLVNSQLIGSLKNIPWYFITSSALVSIFFFAPAIVNPEKLKKNLLIFSLIFLLLLLAVYIIGRTYFGEPLEGLILPFFNLTGRYSIGLLERLDVIFILIFIPVLGLFNTFHFMLLHWAQKNFMPQLNQKRPATVIIILGVIIVLLAAFVPLNNILWQVMLFTNIFNLSLLLLLLAIYFIVILKTRRNRR